MEQNSSLVNHGNWLTLYDWNMERRLSSLDIGLQTLARSEQVFSYHSGADREMQA